MVLIDTSVWIDHFYKSNDTLIELLGEAAVCLHPFIIGELACGRIKNRNEILELLHALPQIKIAEHPEVLSFIDQHNIFGKGLGYIDMHLLASCLIDNVVIFTRDKRLKNVARQFNLLYE